MVHIYIPCPMHAAAPASPRPSQANSNHQRRLGGGSYCSYSSPAPPIRVAAVTPDGRGARNEPDGSRSDSDRFRKDGAVADPGGFGYWPKPDADAIVPVSSPLCCALILSDYPDRSDFMGVSGPFPAGPPRSLYYCPHTYPVTAASPPKWCGSKPGVVPKLPIPPRCWAPNGALPPRVSSRCCW